MIKKVIVLDGEIINVGEWQSTEPIPEGATIEEREMEYSEEYGWHEVGYVPPLSPTEEIAQLRAEKEQLSKTLDMVLTDLIPSLLGGE